MSKSAASLFKPFTTHNLTLPNRFVMAPMTRSKSPGEVPGPEVAAYYRRRAEAGMGLIITEGTTIADPSASNDASVPAFHGEAALAGWANVVREVKAVGGLIAPQLWHQGIARKHGTGSNPDHPSISPSGLSRPEKKVGEAMDEARIHAVVDAFAQGARDAQRLGFDAVEIHGAHGYLIDQFFWEGTNQRDDRFGGSRRHRTTFGVEIIRAIRAAVGPDFPIILRFSQWKQQDFNVKLAANPHELDDFLHPLADAGVDVFHCSTRRFWEPEFEGSDLNLAGWTKKLTGKPTITVGSVGLNEDFIAGFGGKPAGPASLDRLIELFERGDFDLVAVGRAVLVDPQWTAKVREGRFADLVPFTADKLATLW